MVTVHKEAGFRFVICTNDHVPAHVHVDGEGSAKINLAGPDGAPELVEAWNMKRGDIRKAMQIVAEQQEKMLERWRAIHG